MPAFAAVSSMDSTVSPIALESTQLGQVSLAFAASYFPRAAVSHASFVKLLALPARAGRLVVPEVHRQREFGGVLRDRRLALKRRLTWRHEARIVAAERRAGARRPHPNRGAHRDHDHEMLP